MIRGAFQHHSGRVISLGRLVLAAVFLLAIWLDPTQPNQRPDMVYSLLAGYLVWSAGLILLTWRNWWLDFRLAAPAHLVDIAAFGTLVFFTEGYTSPFYTFFVFLLLSAAIRWGWRETALTAAAVLVLFASAGTAALVVGAAEFDLVRLMMRSAYLVVLSLLFIWFGINQQGGSANAASADQELPAEAESPPIQPALRLAAERMKARRMLLVWCHREEPWVNVASWESGAVRSERIGPEDYGSLLADAAEDRPFLFDNRRRRALRESDRSHRLQGFSQTVNAALASRFGLDEGLVVRIRARDYEGELFVLDKEGMCADDLRSAESVGREIVALFDRSSMIAFSEEAAVARARMSLARDLHDSVVQVLAGASFRLEALKSWIRAGQDPGPEIETVKADLSAEQRKIRTFIAGLRGGRGSMRTTDLGAGLAMLAEQLCRRWDLDCDLSGVRAAIDGPVWIEHELHQIIREAAANAVRHGKATRLSIAMRNDGGELELSIADNGIGFAAASSGADGDPQEGIVSPWSVHERVKALGGTLSLLSSAGGSRLKVRVPLETGG